MRVFVYSGEPYKINFVFQVSIRNSLKTVALSSTTRVNSGIQHKSFAEDFQPK